MTEGKMNKIGMLVAVEMDAVLSRYGKAERCIDEHGFQTHVYEMQGYSLYVLNSGAGEIAAAAGTQQLITGYGIDMVVNFGVVGGLTPEMKKTKTSIVRKIVHYDFDISPVDPVKPGQYSGFDSVYIPVTSSLYEKALRIEPSLTPVICASGDKFIASPAKKQSLYETYGAEICEMEAAGIALTCIRNRIPFLMIKTVSDGIEGGAEEFRTELTATSELCLSIVDRIMKDLSDVNQ